MVKSSRKEKEITWKPKGAHREPGVTMNLTKVNTPESQRERNNSGKS